MTFFNTNIKDYSMLLFITDDGPTNQAVQKNQTDFQMLPDVSQLHVDLQFKLKSSFENKNKIFGKYL